MSLKSNILKSSKGVSALENVLVKTNRIKYGLQEFIREPDEQMMPWKKNNEPLTNLWKRLSCT